MLEIPQNHQEFFGGGEIGLSAGHNDEIESLDISPDRKFVATGQRGKNPTIFVWEIESKHIAYKFSQGNFT